MGVPFHRRWLKLEDRQSASVLASALARLRKIRDDRDWHFARLTQRPSEFRDACIAIVRRRIAALLLPAKVIEQSPSQSSRMDWKGLQIILGIGFFCCLGWMVVTEPPSAPPLETPTMIFPIASGLPYLPEPLALDFARQTMSKTGRIADLSQLTLQKVDDPKDSLSRYGRVDLYFHRQPGHENTMGQFKFFDANKLPYTMTVSLQETQIVCTLSNVRIVSLD